jgi:hypothetical protein
VGIIRNVELSYPPGKQCFPMASTKGLGFCNEYELAYILRYGIVLFDSILDVIFMSFSFEYVILVLVLR